MGYLGYKPADKPLTSADITDGIITTTKIADSNITSAKITDATIVNGDIANATIALAKLSATGTPSAATFLRGDNSWSAAGGGTPYFSAKGSGFYSISHATTTKLQYATELYDSDGCYDTSTYRFTPTTAGYYHIVGSTITYKSINDLTDTSMTIFKNGTSGTRIASSALQRYDNSSSFIYAMNLIVSGFGYANGTTDYFEVFAACQQVGGGNVNIDGGNTYFFGYKVA